MARLTAREQEVVRLVARGRSNKAIAHQLGISPRTVEGHLNHVFEKVGSTSRTELVHYALAHGLFVRDSDNQPLNLVTRLDAPEADRWRRKLRPHPWTCRSCTVEPSTVDSHGFEVGTGEVRPTIPSPSERRVTRPTNLESRDRPWTRSGFWLLQLVVLALYLVRLAATVAFHFDATSLVLEFSTLALFIIPVVYAALNYGLAGALFTSGWMTLLAVPRFVSSVHAPTSTSTPGLS